MNEVWFYFVFFGFPIILSWVVYGFFQFRKHSRAIKKLNDSKGSGMTEPASLHPLIDPSLCLGCGTCVSACPEGEILGLINRKAQLVEPSSCIGHGACKNACPTNAISLVFGTETRGIEIPHVNSDFETSVSGIYIAGELGGMGLIRNAISQGQKAVEAIEKKINKKSRCLYDLVIVGAGAAGLAASLTAKQSKLKAITLEQDTIGGTIAHYPRGKVVMTRPAILPIVGKFQFREASKENLMAFWDKVLRDVKLNIKTGVRVNAIEKTDQGFDVQTNKGSFQAANVLLSMGRRGTPRKLNVPGEESSKVTYRLADPEQYINKKVLIVGGGDSALEAAMSIAEQPGAHVVLSYRSASFSRVKARNLDLLEEAKKNKNIRVLLESNVVSIHSDHVKISQKDKNEILDNDNVIVCAGGILPTPFLKKIGIEVEEKFGTA